MDGTRKVNNQKKEKYSRQLNYAMLAIIKQIMVILDVIFQK